MKQEGMYYHMAVTPRYLLNAMQGRTWRQYFHDKAKGLTKADVEEQLRKDAAAGIVYPVGKCDNWDDKAGCQGHPWEEVAR